MSHEDQAQKLVYMANQIAIFFESRPDDEAVGEISNHIVKFWDPRMRAKILAYLEAGGAGLQPRARMAIMRLQPANAVPS